MPSALEALARPIGDEITGASLNTEELDVIRKDLDLDKVVLDIASFKKYDVDVRCSVTAADVDLSIEGAHQLTISIRDAKRQLYRSGALDKVIEVVLRGWAWRLVSDEKQGDDVILTFEPRPVAYLRSHKARRKVSRGKVTRAEFILTLIRAVKKRRIKLICPELHKKQPIEKAEQRDERGRKERRESGIPDNLKVSGPNGWQSNQKRINNLERVLTVGDKKGAPDKVQVATVMCVLQESSADTSATNGSHVGLFQQDPRYWPATREPEKDAAAWYNAVLDSYKKNSSQSLTALIESVQHSGQPQAYAKWRDTAEKIVDEFTGGGGSPSKETRKPFEFKVDKGENYWATIIRLAEEVAWRAFTVKDTLYYISEEDLFKAKSIATIKEGVGGVDVIDHKRDRRKAVQEVTVSCRMKMWPAPLGSVVNVDNGGPADGRYLVAGLKRSYFSSQGTITLRKPMEEKPEPDTEVQTKTLEDNGSGGADTNLTTKGGAKGIVEQVAQLAASVGGDKVYVVSSYRPGSVTTSGNASDHSQNNESQAARDIAVKGIDAIVGPPSPKLDKAVVAVGDAFGRNYGDGNQKIVDTFYWKGYRIQIIWRTPEYGGHMGHIHCGARFAGGRPT